jgi:hypothetical protein
LEPARSATPSARASSDFIRDHFHCSEENKSPATGRTRGRWVRPAAFDPRRLERPAHPGLVPQPSGIKLSSPEHHPCRNIRPACMVRACRMIPPSRVQPLSRALLRCVSEPALAAPWRKQAAPQRAKRSGSNARRNGGAAQSFQPRRACAIASLGKSERTGNVL